MSSITFRALIDGVHYDPKKGIVKIQLVANRISLNKLTSLGPQDESIAVTLESSQTTIDEITPNSNVREEGKEAVIGEEGVKWLKKAATVVEDAREDGEIITEFPTKEKGDGN